MPISADVLLQQQLAAQVGDDGVVAVEFECPGVAGQPAQLLLAVYWWHRQDGRATPTQFLVTDRAQEVASLHQAGQKDLLELAQQWRVPLFDLRGPALLEPVAIPKPWGEEIWFTGIEERGISGIGDGRYAVPLPWYLYAAPTLLANGRHQHINLLKILAPLADPLLGDLYFELHEQKQEVYVVTGVDRTTWPNGQGAIRLGFDSDVRSSYGSDQAFRMAYSAAVASYRSVRRKIDELIDVRRTEEGVALDEPVAPEVQRRWLATVPEVLLDAEQARRAEMNRFTQLWPLHVGDVVQVPLLTPHALQHGVRTVEFQTPVYERKILSFGQKVLTQPEWDTAEAVTQMLLDVPALSRCETLSAGPGWRRERIVTFDDFIVDRLTIDGGHQWSLEADGEYGLLMAVGADFKVGGRSLAHEQACFVPSIRSPMICKNQSEEQGVLLIARPH